MVVFVAASSELHFNPNLVIFFVYHFYWVMFAFLFYFYVNPEISSTLSLKLLIVCSFYSLFNLVYTNLGFWLFGSGSMWI